MKKFGVLIFAAALIVGLVAATMSSFGRIGDKFFNFSFKVGAVKGSGNLATDRRDIAEFHGVDVSGVFKVEIVAQKDFGVEIEADDNLLPLIETKIRKGVLHISTDGKVSSGNPMIVRISAPDIDRIDASGAAEVTLSEVKNSGLTIDSSGASKIKLAGETAKLVIDISGATKVDAEELTAENATVKASGASKVAVNVTGSLRGDASGASRIEYSGSPAEVIKKSSGASGIHPKESN
ncbi:MAG: head GIN domain-containing protein [Pyrinomonadaceae bacterium]